MCVAWEPSECEMTSTHNVQGMCVLHLVCVRILAYVTKSAIQSYRMAWMHYYTEIRIVYMHTFTERIRATFPELFNFSFSFRMRRTKSTQFENQKDRNTWFKIWMNREYMIWICKAKNPQTLLFWKAGWCNIRKIFWNIKRSAFYLSLIVVFFLLFFSAFFICSNFSNVCKHKQDGGSTMIYAYCTCKNDISIFFHCLSRV